MTHIDGHRTALAEIEPPHTADGLVETDHRTTDRERCFDLTLDMLCTAGFDGCFRDLNPAWERVLGWSIQELTSRPFIDFVHPDDVEATAAVAGRLFENDSQTVSFENRYRAKGRILSLAALDRPLEQSGPAPLRDGTRHHRPQARGRRAPPRRSAFAARSRTRLPACASPQRMDVCSK